MLWTDQEVEYLLKIYEGRPYLETVEMLHAKFGVLRTVKAVKRKLATYGVKNGRNTKFGNVPSHNKGKKGYYQKGSEKGWFKKGSVPKNKKPVGSTRIHRGTVIVKVAEPSVWKVKRRVEWEKVNGPIPKGMRLVNIDGDPYNCSVDNLMLVTPGEAAAYQKVKTSDPEMNKVALKIAKLNAEIYRRKHNDNN